MVNEPVGSNAGGFSFDLCKRNSFLEKKGVSPPGLWKTGTTIAGVIYKVILFIINFSHHNLLQHHRCVPPRSHVQSEMANYSQRQFSGSTAYFRSEEEHDIRCRVLAYGL